MNRRITAARPITWALALPLAVVLGEIVVRWALWPVTSFEDTREFGEVVFGQTYRAARKIHAPQCGGKPVIVLLGNSRVQFAVREDTLREELRELDPDRRYCVRNLGIFGAAIGDLEVLERHLQRLDPTLVVLAIDESALQATPLGGLRNVPASLMRIGWSDGPIPATGLRERVDRWLRTAWPLYRYREFIRAAVFDRFLPDDTSEPWPERFDSMEEFFRYAHGEGADEVIDAHRLWRQHGDLPGFLDFLGVARGEYLDWVRKRVSAPPSSTERATAEAVLQVLLERMSRRHPHSVVLVLPRNPLLAADRAGELFDHERANDAISRIERAAARHGIPVVDARSWMPAEAFFDFDHLLPDLAKFEAPLAAQLMEVLDAG